VRCYCVKKLCESIDLKSNLCEPICICIKIRKYCLLDYDTMDACRCILVSIHT